MTIAYNANAERCAGLSPARARFTEYHDASPATVAITLALLLRTPHTDPPWLVRRTPRVKPNVVAHLAGVAYTALEQRRGGFDLSAHSKNNTALYTQDR